MCDHLWQNGADDLAGRIAGNDRVHPIRSGQTPDGPVVRSQQTRVVTPITALQKIRSVVLHIEAIVLEC